MDKIELSHNFGHRHIVVFLCVLCGSARDKAFKAFLSSRPLSSFVRDAEGAEESFLLPVWEKDSSRQTRIPLRVEFALAPSGAESVGRMVVSLISADNISRLSLRTLRAL